MDIEFDSAKDRGNVAKHGVSLARAVEMQVLAVVPDHRFITEGRFRAFGLIDGLAFCLVFSPRDGRVRAISLRRAHLEEFDRYVP